jgi:hypothetical protein
VYISTNAVTFFFCTGKFGNRKVVCCCHWRLCSPVTHNSRNRCHADWYMICICTRVWM